MLKTILLMNHISLKSLDTFLLNILIHCSCQWKRNRHYHKTFLFRNAAAFSFMVDNFLAPFFDLFIFPVRQIVYEPPYQSSSGDWLAKCCGITRSNTIICQKKKSILYSVVYAVSEDSSELYSWSKSKTPMNQLHKKKSRSHQ